MSMNASPGQASLTPNVVVGNPVVRKVATIVLGIAALVLPVLGIIDNSESVEFGEWLEITGQIEQFLLGAFAVIVIAPNVPSQTGDAALIRRAEGMNGGIR